MLAVENARVVTPDGAAPPARVVVVEGRRIARVERAAGDAASPSAADAPADAPTPAPARATRIDARGAALLPAFHDAHVHLTQAGLALGRVALAGARSRAELLERLRAALDVPRDEAALVGVGADESAWADARLPTREELDRIAPRTPVIVKRVCLHKAVVNGPALTLVSERWGGALPARLADARSGLLLEDVAMSLDARVLAPRPEDREPAILRAAELALSRGVATADEIASWPSVVALIRLAEEGRLPLRVTLHILYEDLERARALGLAGGATIGAQGRLTIGGIKLFADGSLGARTAALREPYADAPAARGLLLLDARALAARIGEIERAGFPALVHVIGDAALDAALDAFDAAGVAPGNARRHRIEHAEMVPDARALERLARLGLAVAAQPNFVGNWQGPGGLYEARLGTERARRLNPFATLARAGIPFAFSSDAMPIDPLYGIRSALAHPDPAERLDPIDAVERYTAWGTRINGGDADRGRIVPGAPADLILLSHDPDSIASSPDARILLTLLDGAIVHDAR